MGKINSTLKLGPGIAKNLALGNATVRAIYERRRIQQGFSPDKDQAEYPLTVFHTHAAALAPLRPAGLLDTDFLEIGPGGNVGVGLLMLLAGAKSVTCLDVAPWMQGTGPEALYAALVETAARFPETYLWRRRCWNAPTRTPPGWRVNCWGASGISIQWTLPRPRCPMRRWM